MICMVCEKKMRIEKYIQILKNVLRIIYLFRYYKYMIHYLHLIKSPEIYIFLDLQV